MQSSYMWEGISLNCQDCWRANWPLTCTYTLTFRHTYLITAAVLLDWFEVFLKELSSSTRWQSSNLHTHTQAHRQPWSDKSRSVSAANLTCDEIYRGLWHWNIHNYLYLGIKLCPGLYPLSHTIGTGNRTLCFHDESFYIVACFGLWFSAVFG